MFISSQDLKPIWRIAISLHLHNLLGMISTTIMPYSLTISPLFSRITKLVTRVRISKLETVRPSQLIRLYRCKMATRLSEWVPPTTLQQMAQNMQTQASLVAIESTTIGRHRNGTMASRLSPKWLGKTSCQTTSKGSKAHSAPIALKRPRQC